VTGPLLRLELDIDGPAAGPMRWTASLKHWTLAVVGPSLAVIRMFTVGTRPPPASR
jgi:hypothetical protein